MRRSAIWRVLPVLALLLTSALATWAQTTFGTIVGSVTDASGAAIPQVQVTLTNIGTSEKRVQQTGSDGLYSFVNLLPGHYRLEAEKEGFRHFTREPIVVEVQKTVAIDVSMQ